MSNLTKFTNRAINLETTASLKGGVFCDIYLGHVAEEGISVDPAAMQKAIELDQIKSEKGFIAAFFSGGGRFLYTYR